MVSPGFFATCMAVSFDCITYGDVVTPEEEVQLRQIGQALETVSRWEDPVAGFQAGSWQVAPGSELETDDRLAHPYTVTELEMPGSLVDHGRRCVAWGAAGFRPVL